MPFAGTSDVAEVAKSASLVIRNGSVVVAARPGRFVSKVYLQRTWMK